MVSQVTQRHVKIFYVRLRSIENPWLSRTIRLRLRLSMAHSVSYSKLQSKQKPPRASTQPKSFLPACSIVCLLTRVFQKEFS